MCPQPSFAFFLAIIQSSSPAQHVAILCHTFPRLCHSHLCFHLVRFSGSSFIILVCRDCHHVVHLHLYTCFSESIIAFYFIVAFPSHGTPHAFRNFLKHIRQLHLPPYLPGHHTRSCVVHHPRLGIISSLHLFPSLYIFPVFAVSMTMFHFQKRRRHTHGVQVANISLSPEHLYFSKS